MTRNGNALVSSENDDGLRSKSFFSIAIQKISRNLLLRLLLVFILLAAAAICGSVIFIFLEAQETALFEADYYSLADDALEAALGNMVRKGDGIDMIAKVLADVYPDKEQWPNVAFSGFEDMATSMLKVSGGSSYAFVPLVLPSEVDSFEQFSFNYFDSNPDTITANLSYHASVGRRGIWTGDVERNPDGIVRDVTGYTFWGSLFQILAPVLQVQDMDDPVSNQFVFLNLHSEPTVGGAIDEIIRCSEDAQVASASIVKHCAILTDIVGLVDIIPRAVSILIHPIYPKNNQTAVVGVLVLYIEWSTLLDDVLPDAKSDVVAIVSSETDSFTYIIESGLPRLLGLGSHPPSGFLNYASEKRLTLPQTTGSQKTARYTIVLYPTDDFYDGYHSDNPLFVSLGAVSIILFALFTFLVYDYFMIRESNEKQIVLDTKRQFVRFISHEVRTPLNTVAMGIKLLQMEMQNADDTLKAEVGRGVEYGGFASSSSAASALLEPPSSGEELAVLDAPSANSDPPSSAVIAYLAQLQPWLKVVEEVGESVEDATVVLNDLLNYDKIEMGTLKLEIEAVDMWDLLRGVVRAFEHHGKKSKVSLVLVMDVDSSRRSKLEVSTPCAGEATEGLVEIDEMNRSVSVGSMGSSECSSIVSAGSFSISDISARAHGSSVAKEQVRKRGRKKRRNLKALRVLGDRTRLQQVMRNLVSNALKFTPEGGVVTIRAIWLENGMPFVRTMVGDDGMPVPCSHPRRGSLRVTVTDTGAGLDAEQLKQIFGEGVQFNPNVLQAGQGSGLGLFIAKGIALKHEATLTVHSEGLGHGTTFTAEFPVHAFPYEATRAERARGTRSSSQENRRASAALRDVRSPALPLHLPGGLPAVPKNKQDPTFSESNSRSELASTPSPPSLPLPAPALPPPPQVAEIVNPSHNALQPIVEEEAATSLPILVVDDATSNRRMLMRILKNKGFECIEATHGQEALEKYRAAKIKLNEARALAADASEASGELDVKLFFDEPFAAILMDFEMPVMNGPTATRVLRQEEHCRLLIVGITGNVLPADLKHFKAQGANAVLAKPLNIDAFMELLEQFTDPDSDQEEELEDIEHPGEVGDERDDDHIGPPRGLGQAGAGELEKANNLRCDWDRSSTGLMTDAQEFDECGSSDMNGQAGRGQRQDHGQGACKATMTASMHKRFTKLFSGSRGAGAGVGTAANAAVSTVPEGGAEYEDVEVGGRW